MLEVGPHALLLGFVRERSLEAVQRQHATTEHMGDQARLEHGRVEILDDGERVRISFAHRIGKDGTVVFQQAGALRAEDLDDLIDQAKKLDVAAAKAAESTSAQA